VLTHKRKRGWLSVLQGKAILSAAKPVINDCDEEVGDGMCTEG
jgi:hypothetical protein